jgi:hypothetical protein
MLGDLLVHGGNSHLLFWRRGWRGIRRRNYHLPGYQSAGTVTTKLQAVRFCPTCGPSARRTCGAGSTDFGASAGFGSSSTFCRNALMLIGLTDSHCRKLRRFNLLLLSAASD